MNFFYPADDLVRGRPLDYYRQREWRIACPFAPEVVEIMRPLTQAERERLLAIDHAFFSRRIRTGTGEADALDVALVHPGIGDRSVL
jgi:hypothetical protein